MKKAADQVTSDAGDVDLRESSAGGDLPAGSPLEAFRVFLKLGVSSFGGPIAHIGYFREKFVVRRRWLSEQTFVDLVALCQFLPGPASSQTGFAIGLIRAGYGGALAAWAGFTLPSAILLVLFAYGAGALSRTIGTGLLHGLKLVAVAIVAQAVLGMARNLTPTASAAQDFDKRLRAEKRTTPSTYSILSIDLPTGRDA
jgi:chromate transporter